MKKLLIISLVLVLGAFAQAELMPDGGFESGLWSGSGGFIYMAYPSSYTFGYASPTQNGVAPHAGNYFGEFRLPQSGNAYTWSYAPAGWKSFAGGSGWTAAWQQGLAVSGGDILQASAYLKQLGGPAGSAGIMKIEYYDAANAKLHEDIETFVATNVWTQIVGSQFTAPAGTTNVTMVVAHETGNGGLVGASIGFDDVSLVAVPEPVTLVLLGSGCLFLRRRKA